MGQPIPAPHQMRNRKNKGGFIPNSKGKASSAQTSRGSAAIKTPNARRPRNGLEMSPHEWRPEMGEAKSYYMRCPDLGVHDWELTTGPAMIYAAIRVKLARIDHDEAFPVALGNKKVEMQVRYENSSRVMRFLCSGHFVPKYECERHDE